MNPFDFFERKACLALDADWPTVCQEFERVGLSGVWRFVPYPVDGCKILGPHQSFNASVRQMLVDFLGTDSQNMLSMEGDVIFRDLSHLAQALRELPSDWDIVYLGANLTCCPTPPEQFSEHLFRIKGAWTTHAIGYNRKVVQFILDNQPGFSEEMVDCWLSKQFDRLNAYVVAPMVAYQRPHQSGIWGKPGVDDYTEIFEASDRLLVECRMGDGMIEDPSYTLTYEEALSLLARAVSLKYDIKQNTFAATTKIINALETSRVESITIRFYDEQTTPK